MATFRYPQSQTTITGGATEAKQDAIIVELQDIETDIETGNTSLANIETSTAASATAAKQDDIITELQDIEADVETGNASLASIDGKITAVDTTGKATETKQDNIITELQDIEADVEAGNAILTTIDSDTSSMNTAIAELNARVAGNLVPETFDYINITYVTSGNGLGEIETVTYKTGGAAGTTVATLTLGYDGSDKLSSVTRT